MGLLDDPHDHRQAHTVSTAAFVLPRFGLRLLHDRRSRNPAVPYWPAWRNNDVGGFASNAAAGDSVLHDVDGIIHNREYARRLFVTWAGRVQGLCAGIQPIKNR